jgi:hypothetical protein
MKQLQAAALRLRHAVADFYEGPNTVIDVIEAAERLATEVEVHFDQIIDVTPTELPNNVIKLERK